MVPATFAAPGAGANTVWLTRQAITSAYVTVEVVAATMTGVEDATDPVRMRLRTADGSAVLPGDSGGGVWANGKLIGNVWAGGLRETRYFWGEWLGGDATESSDLVIAALQPLGGQSSSGAEVSFAIQRNSEATHPESKSDMMTKEEK